MRGGSAATVALGGLLALAVAMGIGRFAFTPMLPLMQADIGLSVESGGWLASANYAGYLVGAIAAARLHVAPMRAILAGLLFIAITTLAMGVTHDFAQWVVWRTLAGVASAFVLVHVSSWSVLRLAALQRPALSGVVFAGVGIGVAFAGLLCLMFVAHGAGSEQLWLILGSVAVLVSLAVTPILRSTAGAPSANTTTAAVRQYVFGADAWRLILCYGAFGFGYIIPATFLPVMAREAIADPALFGWAWPIFGIAGVLSTLIGARAGNPLHARMHWAVSHLVLATGCAVPALVSTFGAVLVAALCVGGTFMAITMYAVQEARNVAGERARPLIGAMTAAFALGQMIGPLFVRRVEGSDTPFAQPLLFAAVLLVGSGLLLFQRPPKSSA
jgi:MFS family permease